MNLDIGLHVDREGELKSLLQLEPLSAHEVELETLPGVSDKSSTEFNAVHTFRCSVKMLGSFLK